jgi:putative flippase GtrA
LTFFSSAVISFSEEVKMDLSAFLGFVNDNRLLAAAGAAIILFGLYVRPRLVASIFALALLAMGVLYLVSYLSTLGVTEKERLIRKSEPKMVSHMIGPVIRLPALPPR